MLNSHTPDFHRRSNPIRLNHILAWNGPLVTLLALTVAFTAGLLLIQLTPLGGVLFVGLALLSVATVIEPLSGLAAALFLGLLWAYLRAEVPQIPAQIAQLFVALTLAVWLARGLLRRKFIVPCPPAVSHAVCETNFLLLPLLTFIGAASFSLWDAGEIFVYGVPELIKWVQILLLYLFISDHITPRRLPWLLSILLLIGLFQASVGAWQFGLRGEGPDHFAILSLGEHFYRAYGTFEQPNPYAGYLGLTLSVAMGALWGGVSKWINGEREGEWPRILLYLISTIAIFAALGMSWSRGAWLGFGAAGLAMAFALPRDTRWGLLLVAALVAIGLGLYAIDVIPPSLAARLTNFVQDVHLEDVRGMPINDANYAVVERLAHWQAALEMLRYNLWTGVGFGCYEAAYSQFALINWPVALGHAHNYYLNIAAETGLIGLAAYLLLWGAVFWQTWRLTRRADGFLRGVAIGLLGAWTHLSTHHFLDNLYVNNVHLHIGVLLGLLTLITRKVDYDH